MIKDSKVPIICIANDKYSQKLKSLKNHCLELDFRWGARGLPAHPLRRAPAQRCPRARACVSRQRPTARATRRAAADAALPSPRAGARCRTRS